MFTTRPELVGTFGMVASTHWLASQSGMAVLEDGGNAFDAAVAAGLVLQVVEPHLNGPAGEVPILGYSAGEDQTFTVCGQGRSPATATISHFRDLGLALVPGTGLLPACVPGAFGGWMLMLQRYGTMRLADVMRYAIGYAEHGYPLVARISETIGTVEDMLRDHWPSSAAIYLRNDGIPGVGERFTNPDIALTYRRIVAEAEAVSSDRDEQIEAARAAFYEGFVAEAIDDYFSQVEVMDASGVPHRGLLRYDDLAAWRASIEAPLTFDYHGYTVCKAGPWSQGPVFLQQLALLAAFDLAAMQPGSAELVHTVVECAKLAFADREAFYGDPDFVDVPVGALLDPAYNDERRRLVGENASELLRPGSPGGRVPRLPDALSLAMAAAEGSGSAGTGEPTVSSSGVTSGDTCHLDVVDRHGNMVSATPSGGWLQSSPVVPGLGFALGTRGQMFWLTDGLPNSLAPRKRPRTTLTPSVALRDGRPYLAFGSPGGDKQDQWTLLFFLNHVIFGKNLQESIDAPNWHTSHFPSSFYPRESFPARVHIESRLGSDTVEDLLRRGHEIVDEGPWSLGRVSAVSQDAADGMFRAGANPRGMQGYAVGR